jgi:hypothetical protein
MSEKNLRMRTPDGFVKVSMKEVWRP